MTARRGSSNQRVAVPGEVALVVPSGAFSLDEQARRTLAIACDPLRRRGVRARNAQAQFFDQQSCERRWRPSVRPFRRFVSVVALVEDRLKQPLQRPSHNAALVHTAAGGGVFLYYVIMIPLW